MTHVTIARALTFSSLVACLALGGCGPERERDRVSVAASNAATTAGAIPSRRWPLLSTASSTA
jgi:hypothetical protein